MRDVKQNPAILPSDDRMGPGVVDVDLHKRLAQLLTAQYIVDLHLKIKVGAWRRRISWV